MNAHQQARNMLRDQTVALRIAEADLAAAQGRIARLHEQLDEAEQACDENLYQSLLYDFGMAEADEAEADRRVARLAKDARKCAARADQADVRPSGRY